MKTIHVGLADLVKQSAFQLCHLRKRPELKEVTEEQLRGNELAEEKSTSEFIEMRNTYKLEMKDGVVFAIHFAFDEVFHNFSDPTKRLVMQGCDLFVEHKNIFKSNELSYETTCKYILQLATYASFMELNPDRNLYTAEFYVQQGNPKKYLKAKDPMKCFYQLRINNIVIDIAPRNAKKIVDFYIDKLLNSFDYEDAKAWDAAYKDVTWHLLEDSIWHSEIPWKEVITRTLPV